MGNYRLLRTIGKGNFAKVKLARHILTGREVSGAGWGLCGAGGGVTRHWCWVGGGARRPLPSVFPYGLREAPASLWDRTSEVSPEEPMEEKRTNFRHP